MAHKNISFEKKQEFRQAVGNLPLDKVLFCPIDVSKHFHIALVHDVQGKPVSDFLAFSATKLGFEKLCAHLETTINQVQAELVVIGMEPTGVYYEGLLANLKERYAGVSVPRYELGIVNPAAVKHNRDQHSLRHQKNDYLDTGAIGELLTRGLYTRAFFPHPDCLLIKELSRSLNTLRKQFLSLWNRFLTRLERVFPNLFVAYQNEQPLCQNLLDNVLLNDLLHLCPNPYDLQPLTTAEVIALFHRHQRPLGPKKAAKLLDFAHRALVLPKAIHDIHCRVFAEELLTLDFLKQRIRTLSDQLADLVKRSPARHLVAIPGSSEALIGALVAALEDWHRFERVQQVWAATGFHPTQTQSGSTTLIPHLSKDGSGQLRQAIYQLTCSVVWHEPTFGIPCFERLIAHRPFVHTVIHVGRKLTATALAILHSDQPFRSAYPDAAAAKAQLQELQTRYQQRKAL